MRFTTSSNMKTIDETTVDSYGITEAALMENAGQLTARHIRRKYLDSTGKVLVLCGKGHNGADGMVTGRWLQNWGHSVTIQTLVDPADLEGLPASQFEYIEADSSISAHQYTASSELPDADLYVDALFGTGLQGDPRPPYDQLIHQLNDQSRPVVSIDIPSGLNGDNNRPFDPCVQADTTVTFGLPKLGLLLEPGYSFVGQLITQEIGFPEPVYRKHGGPYHLITPGDVRNFLPVRFPTIHKGSAGRLAVVAGSKSYPGAPFLSARAASRVGSGLTSIIGPGGINEMQSSGERELVFPHKLAELLSSPLSDACRRFLDRQNAYVIGPGLGQSEDRRDGLKGLIPELDDPAVIDADGLNNLRDELSVFEEAESLVLTPHPGEASRLLSCSVQRILDHPIDSVRELTERTGQTVVLKTSRPVVGHPDGTISVNVSGSPALAKAGTGDVLSGLIGGLLAQNLNPGPAVSLALYLHGAAGRHAAEDLDTISVKSEDVVDNVASAIQELESPGTPDWFPVKFESIPDAIYQWNPFQN
ncbi:MAG: NAD(P)H-hydrate dehydratase [bacterium]